MSRPPFPSSRAGYLRGAPTGRLLRLPFATAPLWRAPPSFPPTCHLVIPLIVSRFVLNLLITFLIVSAVIYFLVVVPFSKLLERFKPTPDAPAPIQD